MAIKNCYYCGMSYCNNIPEDVERHQKIHQRKQLAERVFGFIAPRSIREHIKDYAWNGNDNEFVHRDEPLPGGEELIYYAHWCRSIEACNFDLKHPTLQEYIIIRKNKFNELLNIPGGSYINMKKYKEYLNKPFTMNKTHGTVMCISSGYLIDYETGEKHYIDENWDRQYDMIKYGENSNKIFITEPNGNRYVAIVVNADSIGLVDINWLDDLQKEYAIFNIISEED